MDKYFIGYIGFIVLIYLYIYFVKIYVYEIFKIKYEFVLFVFLKCVFLVLIRQIVEELVFKYV